MTERRKGTEDNQIERFETLGLNRFTAGEVIKMIGIVCLLLVLLAGSSVRDQGEKMSPGIGRDLVLAFGEPTGWVSDQLPLAESRHDLTAWLSPDDQLGEGSFDDSFAQSGADVNAGGGIPPVTPEQFDPIELGEEPPPPEPLETLLVTGDSLSTPMDQEIARTLADSDVEVIRDPHLGTGISNDAIVDWGQLSTSQVKKDQPDAVVVFIGANEGYPLEGTGGNINCCSPEWAAAFANRARAMMNTYRQGGKAKVYWLTIMTPRDPARQRIANVVNQAIEVAAQPWRNQIRLIDMVEVFTPGDRYRDSMEVEGSDQIVREGDGIHLNDLGSELAAEIVLERLEADFAY